MELTDLPFWVVENEVTEGNPIPQSVVLVRTGNPDRLGAALLSKYYIMAEGGRCHFQSAFSSREAAQDRADQMNADALSRESIQLNHHPMRKNPDWKVRRFRYTVVLRPQVAT